MTRHINPHDFLKPPTAITAVSLAGVLTGAAHLDTRRGKFLAAVSRLGDLADGYVARRYDMSSDAGALADVVSDKLGMLAIGIGMWKHDIAPKPVLITMAAKHSLNAVATLYNGLGDEQERAIRPPQSGKYSMAADNISLVSFALADELDSQSTGYRVARDIGWIAAGVGAIYGAVAARHYIRGEFDEA